MYERSGDVQPEPHKNGPQKLLGDHEQLLILRLIISNPGIYNHEMKDEVYTCLGVVVSVASICRTLKFMGCARQVIRNVVIQQDEGQSLWQIYVSMTHQCLFG